MTGTPAPPTETAAPRRTVHADLMRNTAWYGVVTLIGLVSGLIMSIVLARGLGPRVMGELSYLLWAERTMTALATLGFSLATVRYTAEACGRGDTRQAWGFARLFLRRQVVVTTLVVALLAPLILTRAPGDLEWLLMVVALGLFPITIESIYSHALQGAQRYDITARTSTIKMSMQLVVAIVAIAAGAGLLTLLLGMLVTLVISATLQRAQVHRVFHASLDAPPAPMTADMRAYIVPLSIVAVLDAIVWDRSEVFFLGIYATTEQIAFYSLAFGLSVRAMIIPEIAVGALLPAFSALHGQGAPEEFARLYRTALRWVALIGTPIAAVVTALAPAIVTWLYGDAYRPAAGLVGALAGVGLLSAMRKVAWAALRAAGDRRCALTATWVAALINVGLAAALIPHYAGRGAVIANAAGQLTATIWVFAGMARAHRARLPGGDLVKIAAAGALSLATTFSVVGAPDDGLRALAAALAGVVAFAIAAIGLRLVGAREWAFLITSTRRLAARATG